MNEDDGQSGDWQRLAVGLADGRRDQEVRDLFWCVLEVRVRGVVLSGPANDPLECRLRPRFRGLLPDAHAAEDFTSDFLAFLLRKFDEGCFHTEDFRTLSASEGLFLDCAASASIGPAPAKRVWKMALRTKQDRGEVVYQKMFSPPVDGRGTIKLPFSDFRLVRGPRLVPGARR